MICGCVGGDLHAFLKIIKDADMKNTERKNNQPEKSYRIALCGRTIRYMFNHPGTREHFGRYIMETNDNSYDIRLTEEFIRESRWVVNGPASDDFLEFQSLMLATGDYLLRYKCTLFHCISFIWNDVAWLMTAPSVTGKTTQLINWMNLYTDESRIINGDKAGIECRKDGSVYVYSSPWRGKEKFGFRNRCEKLGGIILLKQGTINSVTRLTPSESACPLFVEFISYPETERQILVQRDIVEQMIDAVPVWKFINTGDEASTVYLHDTLEKYLCVF